MKSVRNKRSHSPVKRSQRNGSAEIPMIAVKLSSLSLFVLINFVNCNFPFTSTTRDLCLVAFYF